VRSPPPLDDVTRGEVEREQEHSRG
jgi:hypothetical protein